MFCLFSNILICGIEDLNCLNISNFSYIINCSNKLNNCIVDPNYINLNIETINYSCINLLNQVYNWLEQNIQNKIIILDETGLNNAMSVCIFILMKFLNKSFVDVYNELSTLTKINDKNNYISLEYYENYIIKKNFNYFLLKLKMIQMLWI
jgi:hypothetical protein